MQEVNGTTVATGDVVTLGDGRSLTPWLASGVLASHAPAFGAKGTRLFAPCGAAVFCYSVKTAKLLGALAPHSSRVTAVSTGAPREGCADPVASATVCGEVRIWDAKTGTCLVLLRLQAPVLALRWPSSRALLAAVGKIEGRGPGVFSINVSVISSSRINGPLPLKPMELAAFDAAGSAVAVVDGGYLLAWEETWPVARRFPDRPHRWPLTAIAVDPHCRYVAVGDARGAVYLWWGILEPGQPKELTTRAPARWHWHAHPVRSLTHCGPLLLSGGDEGVLCVRNVEDNTLQFVPRFPAPLLHVVASSCGRFVCASLEENSLAVIDGLHGWVVPRWIYALDVPVSAAAAVPEKAGGAALHVLADGTVATTGGGRRVQFLDEAGKVLPTRTVTLDRGAVARSTDPMRRWTLRTSAFNAQASCLLTCEVRRSPALERFEGQAAQSSVCKWWRQSDNGQYVLDSVAHDPHGADVTVAIAHPTREHVFVTASLDGTFKSWDCLPVGSSASAAGGGPTEDSRTRRCWQCAMSGSWRGRPILSGCFTADGTILALGFHGFAVLWEHDEAVELRALPAGEATDRVTQLHSAVARDRPLLLGLVRGGSRQEVLCWDVSGTAAAPPLARLDLAAELLGSCAPSRCVTRLAASAGGGASSLRLLAFPVRGSVLKVWRLQVPSTKNNREAFQLEAELQLPEGRGLLDAAPLATAAPPAASGEAPSAAKNTGSGTRVLCWTTDYELWHLDLPRGPATPLTGRPKGLVLAAPVAQATATLPVPMEEDGEGEGNLSAAGRLLAARSPGRPASAEGREVAREVPAAAAAGAGAQAELQVLDLPTRTTSAQQAGIVPHLVERIAPAHMPSHLLPPPPLLWEAFLAVYGRPSPSAAAAAEALGASAELGAAPAAGHLPTGSTGGGDFDLPPWLREARLLRGGGGPAAAPTGEFVDADWMDGLVREALAAT